jgi:tocopherol cyclase
MNQFHGINKNRSYFEGWYFKHQNEGKTIAFIPGVNFDAEGKKSSFIQVITDQLSACANYPYSDFHVCPRKLAVRLGHSRFSERGVKIDIDTPAVKCKGAITYGPLRPIKSDIMGPFRFVPFMECNHGVISMKQSLNGSLKLNGTTIDFDGGTGYIEKDWGSSFPKSYLWTQCNHFSDASCSIMVSIADIPFIGLNFQGCIGIVQFRGQEYRFATYSGVQIIRSDETGFILKQRDCLLEADLSLNSAQKLFAPKTGTMSRVIRENPSCRARFRFYRGGILLFDLQSDDAGFEYVEYSRLTAKTS